MDSSLLRKVRRPRHGRHRASSVCSFGSSVVDNG